MTDIEAIDGVPETPANPAPAGRTKRAALTWACNLLSTIVTMVAGLFVAPLLLRFLGADRIGANKASMDWFGYLILADLGLGPALGVILMRAQGKGDLPQVASIVRYSLRLYAKITVILIPIGLALAWLMPMLIKVPVGLASELRTAGMLAQLALLFYPLGVFRTVLETQQRGYIVALSLLAQSLLITCVGLGLAWAGWGLIGQATAALIGGLVYVMLTACVAWRQLPPKSQCPPASIRVADLWQLGWPLAINSFGNRINLMTDSIVVGRIFGASSVAAYFYTQRLISLVGGQVNNLVNVSWAALSELKAKGQHDVFESRMLELVRLIISLGLTLTGTIVAFDGHFVRLWVGPKQYGEGAALTGDLLSIFTGMSVVTFGFICLFNWFLDIQGEARTRMKVSFTGSFINLSLSIVLGYFIGLPGVALGTFLGYLCTDVWYAPYLVCSRFGVAWRGVVRSVAKGGVYGLPWAIGMWLFAHSHHPIFADSPIRALQWLGLGSEMGIAGIGALIYCWVVILTPTERAEWRRRLSRRKRHA